ncbi:MAG: nucleotidyltransferase domain-containing protein [Syntrophaceae bacterium]
MKKKQKKAIDEYIKLLNKQYGAVILKAVVYGSVARGEADKDSDVDILIVISDKYAKLKDEIGVSAYEIALKNNVVLSPIVMDESTYEWYRANKDPFYKNIHRDGIEIWTTKSESLLKSA